MRPPQRIIIVLGRRRTSFVRRIGVIQPGPAWKQLVLKPFQRFTGQQSRHARRLRIILPFVYVAFLRRQLSSVMRRIVCPERDDWQATAVAMGFTFHTLSGERYWDESAYYAFSLEEIERGIEGPPRSRRCAANSSTAL